MPTLTPRAAAGGLTTEITPSFQVLDPSPSRADSVATEAAGTPRSPSSSTPSTPLLFFAMPASLAMAPLAAMRKAPSENTRLALEPEQNTSPGILSWKAVVPPAVQMRPCGASSTTTGVSSVRRRTWLARRRFGEQRRRLVGGHVRHDAKRA